MPSTKARKVCLGLSILFVVVGVCCWAAQEIQGPGVANLSNGFNWGLYIALFEFFMGAASGCLLIASVAGLFKAKSLKHVAPYAAVSSLALLVAGGVMIIQDLGHMQNMTYMMTNLNFSSPLAGDVIIMTCFAIVSIVLAYVMMVPLWRESGFVFGRWAQRHDAAEIENKMGKIARVFSVFGLIVGILTPIITSLIFEEMNARLWWNTPLLTLDFLVLAIASGCALVMLVAVAMVGKKNLPSIASTIDVLGKTLVVALVVHVVLFFVQWGMVGASQSDAATLVQGVLAENGALIAMLITCAVVALVLFAMKKVRSRAGAIIVGSVIALVAAFLPRMLMLYAGFNAEPMTVNLYGTGTIWVVPIATGVDSASTFMSSIGYIPSLMEIGVSLLPVGLAIFIVALFAYARPRNL